MFYSAMQKSQRSAGAKGVGRTNHFFFCRLDVWVADSRVIHSLRRQIVSLKSSKTPLKSIICSCAKKCIQMIGSSEWNVIKTEFDNSGGGGGDQSGKSQCQKCWNCQSIRMRTNISFIVRNVVQHEVGKDLSLGLRMHQGVLFGCLFSFLLRKPQHKL